MHILTLRPNATIITLIHKAFFHFLPIPRFNDINIQRFPSNALFLFSLSLFHIYLSIYRRPISQSTIYRSFFQSFPISFPRDINLLPWHVVRWRIMHFAKPCPAAGNIGFMRTRYFVIYDQGIIHRARNCEEWVIRQKKKKKNLILWTKPFHFPISSKIRSIRSLSRSDAHVHVFRVDKRRGTFVLRCVTVIDTVLSIDKFANENVGEGRRGKNRFLSKNVWTREGGYKREISRATCHDPLILLLS